MGWSMLKPPTRTPDQQIFILLDCLSVTDLSSGCDFCALRLNFETREVRVECHKRNASVQTLFVQPNCHWDELNTWQIYEHGISKILESWWILLWDFETSALDGWWSQWLSDTRALELLLGSMTWPPAACHSWWSLRVLGPHLILSWQVHGLCRLCVACGVLANVQTKPTELAEIPQQTSQHCGTSQMAIKRDSASSFGVMTFTRLKLRSCHVSPHWKPW